MGQFSWLDCKTGKQIVDNKYKKVYLLVPRVFGGGHIEESCYDGYGRFGGQDVYDLVADWNRKFISQNPDFVLPYSGSVNKMPGFSTYIDLKKSRRQVIEAMKKESNMPWYEWRSIGIDLACYDEDNAALPYPIKITYDENDALIVVRKRRSSIC